ncbi:hypothetical protein [Bradyrhizobium sp. CCBAU 53421]|uniref:hypothetical protein n=1 Tax=Bradyrhizobium sp. CCBAU 53421 TaxID=1325120 RepID=UPI00188C4D56|nr:hypothetical protein [Bradyrhizobium sp. CCBAU 53421]QOZ36375.1 hypothetical protein XH92_35910 [Bradyrhizobium sp. CCBAU 53421]
MATQEQYGKLVVRSLIVDANGNEVSHVYIGSNSGSSRHLVEVENWSTVSFDVDVDVELPQGQRRLSFDGATSSWTANVRALADGENDRDEKGIQANGASTGHERIHCTAVKWKKAGHHRWTVATAGLPLKLAVSVE